jgi:hypothetical protein
MAAFGLLARRASLHLRLVKRESEKKPAPVDAGFGEVIERTVR